MEYRQSFRLSRQEKCFFLPYTSLAFFTGVERSQLQAVHRKKVGTPPSGKDRRKRLRKSFGGPSMELPRRKTRLFAKQKSNNLKFPPLSDMKQENASRDLWESSKTNTVPVQTYSGGARPTESLDKMASCTTSNPARGRDHPNNAMAESCTDLHKEANEASKFAGCSATFFVKHYTLCEPPEGRRGG